MEEAITHILSLSDRKEIERAVHHLPLPEAYHLLEFISKSPKEYEEKVIPILTGLDLTHFISCAPSPVFKPFVALEALQHKMNQAVSFLKVLLLSYREELDIIDEKLTSPQPVESLNALALELQKISHEMEDFTPINPILELAWLSGREDLTEAMSFLKGDYLHLLSYVSRIQKSLDQQREKVFGSLNHATSLDALATLGIIYSDDYLQVLRLLGKQAHPEDQDLSLKLENALKSVHLSTIGDFKERQIFTKEQLFAYLNQSR